MRKTDLHSKGLAKTNLQFPLKTTYKLTAGFDEMRPLSLSPAKRWHVHGAEDWGGPINTPLFAPESGKLYCFFAVRQNGNQSWDELYWDQGLLFAFRNYFYDMYGGLLILEGESGYVHVFAHIYMNQLFNKGLVPGAAWEYREEKSLKRFPVFAIHTLHHPLRVRAEALIGYSGNAGYSTGPHIHYEVHTGRQWQRWEDRPRPSELYGRKGEK
jgi:murein DD-endopeptidase MepM/ murein hydrolase activator NlpD